MGSQTGGNPKWFLLSVRHQTLSEIRVGKSRKLDPLHYVLKSESDEVVQKCMVFHVIDAMPTHTQCQSCPKVSAVLAKFCQSSAQIIPKSSPSCPQVVPKMSPSHH